MWLRLRIICCRTRRDVRAVEGALDIYGRADLHVSVSLGAAWASRCGIPSEVAYLSIREIW